MGYVLSSVDKVNDKTRDKVDPPACFNFLDRGRGPFLCVTLFEDEDEPAFRPLRMRFPTLPLWPTTYGGAIHNSGCAPRIQEPEYRIQKNFATFRCQMRLGSCPRN